MGNIVITNTYLPKTGKTGIIKPDADGYRTVILGGFGIANESGIYYEPKSAVTAIKNGPILRRKIEKGMLYGEADHPDLSGLTDKEAIERMFLISAARRSHTIRDLVIVTDKYKDKNGQYFPAVEGKVRPSGNEYGKDLEQCFSDPYQNTAFSIRSYLDTTRSTSRIRYIQYAITWDWITEPGIFYANKYNARACESRNEYDTLELSTFRCNDEVIDEIINDIAVHGGTEDIKDIATLLSSARVSSTIIPAWLK
jgi:hypothetical protein